MTQSSQRTLPSTFEKATRVGTIGLAPVTRLRPESSVNDATHVDRSALPDDAWPWDRCAIAESRVVESEASALDSRVRPLSYELYQEAQHRRAAFLGDLIAGATRGIGAAVLRAWARYRQSRHARATYDALHQLDDRSLHDLGFAREEIRSVAAEMAGQAQYSRRLLRSTLHAPQSFLDTMFRD
jgi:uncharacterized protein YjiS (DUF1127 family)